MTQVAPGESTAPSTPRRDAGHAARLPLADSPLGRTIATTATDIWNDSCAVDELEYAISYGAVGATANPTIVTDVWKADPAHWRGRVRALADERPDATEVDLAWAIVEEMSLRAAPLLAARLRGVRRPPGPALDADRSDPLPLARPDARAGRSTSMGSPRTSSSSSRRPRSASRSMEEATYRGVNVNATVSFSVAQAVAAAEAVERGLRRREAEGLPVDDMGPVITLMMGRLEDWLRVQTERDGIVADPTACPGRASRSSSGPYAEFGARGLRARLAGRRDPPPPPLVGAHRRRRRHHDAGDLAAPLQRVRRSRSGRGWTNRSSRRSSTSSGPLPRFRPGLTSPTA